MAGSQAGDLGSVPRGLHNARPQGSDGLGFLWDTRCRPAAPWGQQPLSWNAGHRQGPAGGPEYLRRLAGQDMRAPGPGSSLPSGKGHFLSLSLSWPSPSLPATGCWSLSFCSSGMWGDSAAPPGCQGTAPTPAAAGRQRASRGGSHMQVALIPPRLLPACGGGDEGRQPPGPEPHPAMLPVHSGPAWASEAPRPPGAGLQAGHVDPARTVPWGRLRPQRATCTPTSTAGTPRPCWTRR